MYTTSKQHISKLSQASKNMCFELKAFTSGFTESKRRLESIGMTPGVSLCVMETKGNGTLIVRLRSCKWAIGKELAEHIEVIPISDHEYRQRESERL